MAKCPACGAKAVYRAESIAGGVGFAFDCGATSFDFLPKPSERERWFAIQSAPQRGATGAWKRPVKP